MSMKSFNKAAIAVAVAGAFVAPVANAVNIAEDGLGEYIYSPLYTVRGGYNTYINVTNTSEETVIFKIRFREHLNSRDVRDFNVVLSPFDVWTASLSLDNDGVSARLDTTDKSCTIPNSIASLGTKFTNLAYSGGQRIGSEPTTLERTQQGYFEIINMGTNAEEPSATGNSKNIHDWALHKNGVPDDCAAIEDEFRKPNGIGEFELFDEPENALKVNVAIVDVSNGLGFAVPVTTLANWRNGDPLSATFQDQSSGNNVVLPPGDTGPNADDAYPFKADIHTNIVGQSLTSSFEDGADAVSAVLMRGNAINQFRSEDNADTDWVVTFPTKSYYTAGVAVDPFVEGYGQLAATMPEAIKRDPKGYGSCVGVRFDWWDREEAHGTLEEEIQPSPALPIPLELCREVNVIEFGDGVLKADEAFNLADKAAEQGKALPATGWAQMFVGPDDANLGEDDDGYDLVSIEGDVYQGLPMIGFALQRLDNWWSGQGNGYDLIKYGFSWEHAYGRDVYESTGAGTYMQVGNNPAYIDLSSPVS